MNRYLIHLILQHLGFHNSVIRKSLVAGNPRKMNTYSRLRKKGTVTLNTKPTQRGFKDIF